MREIMRVIMNLIVNLKINFDNGESSDLSSKDKMAF